MFDQLQRLLSLLTHLPETMQSIREQADRIALYAQYAIILGAILGGIYVLRVPFSAIFDYFKWSRMRDIDHRESVAKEVGVITQIAQAIKPNGDVTQDDLNQAAQMYVDTAMFFQNCRPSKPKKK